RAGPEPDIALHGLGRLDERNQLQRVALDRETGQLLVGPAGDLVVGVAIGRVVARPDRNPAEGEPRAVGAIEQIDRQVAIGLAEQGEIAPAELVEGTAKALPDLRRR